MPFFKDAKGVWKTFVGMTREEWQEMDHKAVRIVSSLVGFIIATLIWWYFLRGFSPFF